MVNYKVTGDSELNFKTILFTSNLIALFLGGKWNFPYILLYSRRLSNFSFLPSLIASNFSNNTANCVVRRDVDE